MNKMMHSQSLQSSSSADGASQVAVLEHPLLDDVVPEVKGGQHFVVIPIGGVDKLSMKAVRYAKVLDGKIVAVHILLNPSDRATMEYRWEMQNIDIPLIILRSPNGSLIGPLTTFVDGLRSSHKESIVTIVLPVLIGLKWWQRILHNQTAGLIEKAFQSKEGVVITRVPYSLRDGTFENQ
jgi:hypothetical protein